MIIRFIKILVYIFIFNELALSSVIITEIMPAPENNEPEWIEVFNNSVDNLFFDSLSISDPSKTIKIKNLAILPHQYSIFTSDSIKLKLARVIPTEAKIYQVNLPTLNNTTDYIVIHRDSELIDSIYYDMKWGKAGKSLERIDLNKSADNKSNWQISYDSSGATAGKINSVNYIFINNLTTFTINEIMFDVDTDNTEYIELYNFSDTIANLKNLTIIDASLKPIKINDSIIVASKSYITLSNDSNIFNKFNYLQNNHQVYILPSKLSLNNSDDEIVLKDYQDSTIDSVHYYRDWHNPYIDNNKGISLEKVSEEYISNNRNSWSSSTNFLGGTPSLKNSLSNDSNYSNSYELEPNPYSYTKHSDELLKLKYKLASKSSKLTIKIYDTKGYLVVNPIVSKFIGNSGDIYFEVRDKNNLKLEPAPYVILIEILDTQTNSIEEFNLLFVVSS